MAGEGIQVTIERERSTMDGTFGKLTVMSPEGLFICETLELPWKANLRNISCIPCATYECELYSSSRFGRVYLVKDVPGRGGILIHPGNTAGDEETGLDLRSDVRGCILLGLSRGVSGKQRAILHSRSAVSRFQAILDGDPFTLTIIGEGD